MPFPKIINAPVSREAEKPLESKEWGTTHIFYKG